MKNHSLETPNDHWLTLPPELWVAITSWLLNDRDLYRLRCVCSRLQPIANDRPRCQLKLKLAAQVFQIDHKKAQYVEICGGIRLGIQPKFLRIDDVPCLLYATTCNSPGALQSAVVFHPIYDVDKPKHCFFHGEIVQTLCIRNSSDSSHVFIGTNKPSLVIWDLRKDQKWSVKLPPAATSITSLASNSDKSRLFFADRATIKLATITQDHALRILQLIPLSRSFRRGPAPQIVNTPKRNRVLVAYRQQVHIFDFNGQRKFTFTTELEGRSPQLVPCSSRYFLCLQKRRGGHRVEVWDMGKRMDRTCDFLFSKERVTGAQPGHYGDKSVFVMSSNKGFSIRTLDRAQLLWEIGCPKTKTRRAPQFFANRGQVQVIALHKGSGKASRVLSLLATHTVKGLSRILLYPIKVSSSSSAKKTKKVDAKLLTGSGRGLFCE